MLERIVEIYRKINRALDYRFDTRRVARRTLPWAFLMALAASGFNIAFVWSFRYTQPGATLTLPIVMTVFWVFVGLIIVALVPLGMAALAERVNALLTRLTGRKRVDSRQSPAPDRPEASPTRRLPPPEN